MKYFWNIVFTAILHVHFPYSTDFMLVFSSNYFIWNYDNMIALQTSTRTYIFKRMCCNCYMCMHVVNNISRIIMLYQKHAYKYY